MIDIKINQEELKRLYLQKLDEKIKEVDVELVFWDTTELKRRTKMCWNTIQDKFFYDPRFPKYKIGNKWYFPAKECEEFLIEWIKEQSTY